MIKKEEIYIPCFHDMRTLHIYLPNNYELSKQRYPVLYMYDGHNLFYDEEATYGTCWGLRDYLDETQMPLIIIGIECNHHGYSRLEEFSPYDFIDTQIGTIHGRGKEFMEWVTTDLKKWVDHNYRTLPKRKNTGIAGSSMGGLMSLYSILHHNDTFSRAACLSSFLYGIHEELLQELNQANIQKDTRVYMSWGSDEFRSKNQLARASICHQEILRQLQQKGARTYANLVFKGRHAEASWQTELATFLTFLFES